ncbi:MAG: hypothetical protein OXI80_03555 [Caldilineaceae bacterium]|nr:hypothetical protein [Caldilineaceae bacterium]MDE0336723.1 hypothetical protein [Caldilineaceae bacterium]
MRALIRQSSAVLAVASILAYVGLISLSHIRDYVPWPADMLALSLVAALCGALLAAAESRAILLFALAAILSAFLFGSYWAFASWALLRGQLPALDILFSDYVFVYTVQRGFLLVAPSIVFGLLGVFGVQLLLSKVLRR